MATFQLLLCSQGFSRRVATFLARAWWRFTVVVYQCKWRWYSWWCPWEGHTILTLTSQSLMLSFYTCTRIATFLLCSQGLQGYVCLTASSVWKGFDLSTDQLLWEVIHTFSGSTGPHRGSPLECRFGFTSCWCTIRTVAPLPRSSFLTQKMLS